MRRRRQRGMREMRHVPAAVPAAVAELRVCSPRLHTHQAESLLQLRLSGHGNLSKLAFKAGPSLFGRGCTRVLHGEWTGLLHKQLARLTILAQEGER
ncbi:hypothetical protein HaLaN_28184 [Haematococcus lacustris]|uniref:Uncharacterized protein n=1 Tax=Haematococcus lacustris TaxID=44745 RepID=A0A6A0AA78_HAELA|nr:hypothetical protein HaLaN_28184 [Haematococcus lacustris]